MTSNNDNPTNADAARLTEIQLHHADIVDTNEHMTAYMMPVADINVLLRIIDAQAATIHNLKVVKEAAYQTIDAARLADELQDIYDWLAKLNSVKSYTDLRPDMGTLMNITHGYLNRATEIIDALRADLAAANERVTALETQLTDAHIENEYWRAAVKIEPPPAAPSEPPAPVVSDTTDWGARRLDGDDGRPGIRENMAHRDSLTAGYCVNGGPLWTDSAVFDGMPEYTAEPPAAAAAYPDHYDPQAIARAIAEIGDGVDDLEVQQQLRGLSLLNILNASEPVPAYEPPAAAKPAVKLTPRQIDTLKKASVASDVYVGLGGEVNGNSAKSLVRLGLMEPAYNWNSGVYRITPAGRAALRETEAK